MEDGSITGALSFDDFEAIGDGLVHDGWDVIPSFLPAAALAPAAEAQAHWQAGLGRGAFYARHIDQFEDTTRGRSPWCSVLVTDGAPRASAPCAFRPRQARDARLRAPKRLLSRCGERSERVSR